MNDMPANDQIIKPDNVISSDIAPQKDAMAPSGELLRLLLLAKEDDEAAFTELVSSYRPMLEACAAQYRSELSPQDFEELEQELLVAFHKSVKRYDVLYGDVSFGLYAKICVGKAAISALRRIWRDRRETDVLPFVEEEENSLLAERSPADLMIEEETADELKARINSALSRYENTVWWMYYSGMSPSQIAVKVGKTPKSVGNALSRIRQKLRSLLS